MNKRIRTLLATLCLAGGSVLLLINIYGLTQDLAPASITVDHLRFKEKDVTMSRSSFFENLPRKTGESDSEFAERLTYAIAATIAHIHWLDYPPAQFNQRVPIWENYILYFMGRFSGIPEYERYHFASPEKSIERGIGICGDTSMILSQLLAREGIANKIITIPGHVMVEADFGHYKRLLDADFGIALNRDVDFYRVNPAVLIEEFNQAGFIYDAESFIARSIQESVIYWDGVSHFITKKFYFEKLSYFFKWFVPLFFIIVGIFLWRKVLSSSGDVVK